MAEIVDKLTECLEQMGLSDWIDIDAVEELRDFANEPVDALDEEFREVLREHNSEFCPDCGRHLNRLDTAWNNADTDAGTGYSVLEVICFDCKHEIACVHSWYPSIDDFEDFIKVLAKDWKD